MPHYCVSVIRALVDWWDSVELWFTQLAFPLQVLLAAVLLLPLCWFTAAGADRVLDRVTDLVTGLVRSRRTPPRGEVR
ncbi:hypothetical protein SAMN05443637_12630 [Pseudonocardia thermophila]|uniref:Uncharacterized protein n=1 Tax=Pseudonocardia thermophila TaxID=1848 RepID=A0A1M7A5R8_PSETH|nr:hypothetical protein SAMN05443637_12630 [Pseudonocardia thermophila]